MEPMTELEWNVIVHQSDAIEFDWFAHDRLGHMAAFSSFGRGAIPNAVKFSRETYNELFELVGRLPERTQSILVFKGKGRYDDWDTYSRQGLFGYDYQDAHRKTPLGQYDLITLPKTPIQIGAIELPAELLCMVPFIDVEFGKAPFVSFDVIPR